jgi:lysozyme
MKQVKHYWRLPVQLPEHWQGACSREQIRNERGSSMTKAEQLVIPLIEKFEGYCDHAYQDSVGIWTIGFGTTHYPNGHAVRHGDTCTRNEAEEWLLHDLKHSIDCVHRYAEVELAEHQLAALYSWVYNLGCGAFRKSTMLKQINRGHFDEAATEMKKWCHAGGKLLAGLVRRRDEEAKLFLT